jgi:cell division transport system ATP-binding protein
MTYGDQHTYALNHVSLTIEDGEFVFIVGDSGAGKTTLFKLLIKEMQPTSGEIFVNGKCVTRLKRRRIPMLRRDIGVVFQNFRMLKDRNVYENIAFAQRAISAPAKDINKNVAEVLTLTGISEKYRSFPDQLSGGEQQRVALARALANNPRIIIADEPTANLDPKMKMEIMNLLLKINSKGKTVIVVTHERNLVDYFQKRVVTIQGGHIIDDHVGGMFDDETV